MKRGDGRESLDVLKLVQTLSGGVREHLKQIPFASSLTSPHPFSRCSQVPEMLKLIQLKVYPLLKKKSDFFLLF